jgi:hypothetical protein
VDVFGKGRYSEEWQTLEGAYPRIAETRRPHASKFDELAGALEEVLRNLPEVLAP